ncbi:unannotated protein [freshwater metagenome]|uniref:Unannotated protein n=1 Tax=freshwater metagenome TaxID=449393 RepID=A0A6J6EHD9_9ZZZZ
MSSEVAAGHPCAEFKISLLLLSNFGSAFCVRAVISSSLKRKSSIVKVLIGPREAQVAYMDSIDSLRITTK